MTHNNWWWFLKSEYKNISLNFQCWVLMTTFLDSSVPFICLHIYFIRYKHIITKVDRVHRNRYFALEVFHDKIKMMASYENKNISLTFKPIKSQKTEVT